MNALKCRLLVADRAAVTAEFSVVLPAVVVVTLVVFGVGRTVIKNMQCNDAATQVAYQLLTHQKSTSVERIVSQVAGSDATVTVSRQSNRAQIVVQCPIMPDPLHVIPAKVESRLSQIIVDS